MKSETIYKGRHYSAHYMRDSSMARALASRLGNVSPMTQCKRCLSYAINPHCHGRESGVDLDLCDVCYWRKRAENKVDPQSLVRSYGAHKDGKAHYWLSSEKAFNALCDDPRRFTAGIVCHGCTAEPGRWYVYIPSLDVK